MRANILSGIAVIIALAALVVALGQQPRSPAAGSGASHPDAATRMEADKDAGLVRIMTGGEQRAVFDGDGLHISGDIAYTGTLTDISDARLKSAIRPLPEQLSALQALRPVSFAMADDPAGRSEFGLIAQDVESIYPALVQTRPGGTKAVNYSGLIAPLIAAVQELRADNTRLRGRVETLESAAGAGQHATEAR